MMKAYFYNPVVLFLALSATSCARQVAPVSSPVKEPVLPQADFVTQPAIKNNKLKAEISYRKLTNQNITFTVSLQTLSKVEDQTDVSDVKIIAQGEFRSTSTQPVFAKVGSISFNEDLANYRLSSQDKKVRLKIVMAQAGSTPENWQQAKAQIVFSKWLNYNRN